MTTGAVSCTVPASVKPLPIYNATFQMYANVDAEGDLGSNYGAVSAQWVEAVDLYRVTFAHPIGSCAAAVQVGKAGGTDSSTFVSTIVFDAGTNTFDIEFSPHPEQPFMLTVTCRS